MDDSGNSNNTTIEARLNALPLLHSEQGLNDVRSGIERFPPGDLITLRNDLLQGNVDSFQAAQIVANFLGGLGYGVSSDEARAAASRIEVVGATAERIQQVLETVALPM